MKLFYEKRIIHSPKSSARIYAILSAATGKWPFSGKDFIGEVEEGKFELCPMHFGKNSVIPYLYGTVIETDDGCDVEIVAKPYGRSLILPFMVFCGIFSVINFFSGIYSLIANGFSSDAMSDLLLLPIIAGIFIIFHFAFSFPLKKAFQRLEELLL